MITRDLEPYDYSPTPGDFGLVYLDEIPDLDMCESVIRELVQNLHSHGNPGKVIMCIDELAGLFGVKVPQSVELPFRKA